MQNPKDKSLTFHLLLPLLELPLVSLGSPENIKGVYLATDSDTLVVEVKDRTLLKSMVLTHPNLLTEYQAEDSYWLHFTPGEYQSEFHHFRQGHYSQFSPKANQLFLKQWASLGYKTFPLEDNLLYWAMSTVNPQKAREYWAETLAVDLSIIPQDTYYLPSKQDLITL